MKKLFKVLLIIILILILLIAGVVGYVAFIEKDIPLNLIPAEVDELVAGFEFGDIDNPKSLPDCTIRYTNTCKGYTPETIKEITLKKEGSDDILLFDENKKFTTNGVTVADAKKLSIEGEKYFAQRQDEEKIELTEETWKEYLREEYEIASEFVDFDNGGRIQPDILDMYDNHRKAVKQKGTTIKYVLEKDNVTVTFSYNVLSNKLTNFTKIVKDGDTIISYSQFDFNY